jgi:hypothetical protein
MSSSLLPYNPLQRSGREKVHAPNCFAGVWPNGYAPQVRRAAAERGRWAALPQSHRPGLPRPVVDEV